MIRQVLAAISFLTRISIAVRNPFTAKEVGQSARWFPLVGVMIGGAYVVVFRTVSPLFPSTVVALLIVTTEALLTGALHLDGLADMADGFGGGRTREDVLRIMRDHAIGAYGAVALVLLILLKTTLITTLIDRHCAVPYLVIAPTLGRWSTVLLNNLLPYARRSESDVANATGNINNFVGRPELIVATLTALIVTPVLSWRTGIASWMIVIGVSLFIARMCRRRIGGITGDTLGANTELCEVGVFLIAIAVN